MNIDCHQWAITTLGLAELALREFPPILWCQTLFSSRGCEKLSPRSHFLTSSQDINIYIQKIWKPKIEELLLFLLFLQTAWHIHCVFPQSAWCNHCYRHNLWLPWWDGRRLPADDRLGETLQIPKSFYKPVLPQTRDAGCQDGASTGPCGECGPANAVTSSNKGVFIYFYIELHYNQLHGIVYWNVLRTWNQWGCAEHIWNSFASCLPWMSNWMWF